MSKKHLPLPRISGPKLHPFRGTASAGIEFLTFIGSHKDQDSKVWKVRIDKHVYALKIFGFQNWKFLAKTEGAVIRPQHVDPLHRPPLTPHQVISYLDPFNCECRVYGRLKQEQCEDLAIRTHGYILLTPQQERAVTEALGHEYIDWANHPKNLNYERGTQVFDRWEVHRHQRLRAIVKDYVPRGEDYPFIAAQIPQMYADLEKLHELGILVRDIHMGNYLGGKLVDFSMAWTMYHPCLERTTEAGILRSRLEDPERFEEMLDQWCLVKGEDMGEVYRLKPRALVKWRENEYGREEKDAGIDPRLYDWRKWERDMVEEEDEEDKKEGLEQPGVQWS